jgi:hypothetical protein
VIPIHLTEKEKKKLGKEAPKANDPKAKAVPQPKP